MMPRSLKYVGRFFLLLACLSSVNACSKPNEKVLTPIPTKKPAEVFNLEKENTLNKKDRIAGSKVSGKWIYGNNGAIACRIKEWYVTGTEESPQSYINTEVINIKSRKPINVIYDLLLIDRKGQALRTFSNTYRDNQTNITDFKPPLQKGQTKITSIFSKVLLVMSKVDLKSCRVAEDNENYSTINPEMKGEIMP
jgi:hypothetical protein